jgi:hypothetical protein
MRITWCPGCHTRYRDGSKVCEHCKKKTRWVIACPRCGQSIVSNNYKVHYRSCLKIPRPDELADLFDRDPTATAKGIARRYGVHSRAIERRLMGTRWTIERLRVRGRQVYANNMTATRWGSTLDRPTTPCRRCLVLGQKLDKNGLCDWCLKDVKRNYGRLESAVILSKRGYSLSRDHWLNSWDLNYVIHRITA